EPHLGQSHRAVVGHEPHAVAESSEPLPQVELLLSGPVLGTRSLELGRARVELSLPGVQRLLGLSQLRLGGRDHLRAHGVAVRLEGSQPVLILLPALLDAKPTGGDLRPPVLDVSGSPRQLLLSFAQLRGRAVQLFLVLNGLMTVAMPSTCSHSARRSSMARLSSSENPPSLLNTTVPMAPAASGISCLRSVSTVSKRLPGMLNSFVNGFESVTAPVAAVARTRAQA